MFTLINIIRFSFAIILPFVITNTYAQSESFENNEKEELKKYLNFDDWGGKVNEIRNGINLSSFNILGLSDAKEIKPKKTFIVSKKDNGESFVKYRSQWQLTKNDFIEITISFLNSGLDAQEYLIDKYMLTPLPLEIRKKSRDNPTIVGNVSFYNGRLFIRNNIIVQLYAEGQMMSRIEDISKSIDSLLLDQKIVHSYDDFVPRIETKDNNDITIIEP